MPVVVDNETAFPRHLKLSARISYNIIVQPPATIFEFGLSSPPQPFCEVLNNVAAEDMVNDANYKLLRYMDPIPTESIVFAVRVYLPVADAVRIYILF
jgi:hypothetical protein